MAQASLDAQVRNGRGSGAAGRLRRSGRIPAVIYGHVAPRSVSVGAREFHKLLHTAAEGTIVTLNVDDAPVDVLIKDYDEDIRTGEVGHIDFYEIERGKKLHTHVSIELVGSPVGVREGGVLEHTIYDVDIECLPKDIPEHITIDVSALERGQSLHIRDIQPPEGVVILNSADQTVVSIAIPKQVEEETDEGEDEFAAVQEPAEE